jgi:hypothetical protein
MTLIAIWIWLASLGLHACTIWRFVRRRLVDASHDERLFASVVAGIGTLSAVLHVLALTAGLTLTRGVIGLAVLDAAIWLSMRHVADRTTPRRTATAVAIAEFAAAIALMAIVLAWIDHASMSALVDGTDAAHYHVPVAVNLARGARLFDLPATPHTYPMTGSMLDAWFILPLGSPLLVDAAMGVAVSAACGVAALDLSSRHRRVGPGVGHLAGARDIQHAAVSDEQSRVRGSMVRRRVRRGRCGRPGDLDASHRAPARRVARRARVGSVARLEDERCGRCCPHHPRVDIAGRREMARDARVP